MEILKKQLKYKVRCMAVIVFIIAIIAGSATVAIAMDLPASTFLPFNNNQSVKFNTNATDCYVYPTGSNYIFISYQHDIITGDQDIKAQKLDADGKELWKKVYSLKGQDTLLMMHMQGNGFVMAVNSRETEKNTIRLLQISSNGEIVWQKDLPLNDINSVASTNDDGFVIAGTTGKDNQDIRVIKMDKSGQWHSNSRSAAKWEKNYVNSGNQQPSQIIQLLDKEGYNDGYILTGYTDGNTNGKRDLYMMRLNAYGEVKWSKNYGGTEDDEGTSIALAVDSNNETMGFFVAGNTVSRRGDKNIYLIYVDKHGYLQGWPGYQRVIDGEKQRQFGGEYDQLGMAIVPVPDGFKDSRKTRGESVEGQGGAALVGYSSQDKSVLVIRINEFGHVLWNKKLPIPGENLMIGTLTKGTNTNQDLAYSFNYPDNSGGAMEVHTLKMSLEGILEQDKVIPKDDQLESNYEKIHWEKHTLKYEAMRDISKELKDLLSQQPHVPLIAGSGRGEIDWPDTSYYLGNLLIGKADG